MDACNFPELLALDLETAESLFASKRMTAGAPRPMDVIFESNAQGEAGLDLADLAQVNSILSKAAALAYASPRTLAPTDTNDDEPVASSPTSTHRIHQREQSEQHRSQRDHTRSKSTASTTATTTSTTTTTAVPRSSDLDDNPFHRHYRQIQAQDEAQSSSRRLVDPYEQPRPTTATGVVRDGRDSRDSFDGRYSPGPAFSISWTRTKPSQSSHQSSAVPRYAGSDAVAEAGGDHWDSDSVDSFELPSISLSRADRCGEGSHLPQSRSAPSVHQRIQLQEDEQRQQMHELKELQQRRQLQQLLQLQQQLQEKQRLQQQLEKQLQLQFQHEQELSLKDVSQKRKERVGPFEKESSDKENVRKEAASHLPQGIRDREPLHGSHDPPHTHNSHLSHNSLNHSNNSHRDLPAHAHRDSDGSLYDSYDDSASESSFGFGLAPPHHSRSASTGPGAASVRGRQQSVVTTATSVTSGADCRFSSQSLAQSLTQPRTLSAMGLYPSTKSGAVCAKDPRASLASSGDRHVEFNLHDDDDDEFDARSSLGRRGSSTKATTADGSDREEAAGVQSEKEMKNSKDISTPLPPNQSTGNVSQSSWMRFDDEDEETYEDIIKDMSRGDSVPRALPLSMDDTAVVSAFDGPDVTSLPPRPKTSAGHSERSVPTDFRAMNDWASKAAKRLSRFPAVPAPAPAATTTRTIHVPQRRSSLGQAALESFSQVSQVPHQQQQQPKQNYVHQLRHFLSFSDASVYSSDLPRGNISGGLRSLYERPKTSSSSHYRFGEDKNVRAQTIHDVENIDEPLVFLERTVYRKPVPGPKSPKPTTTSEHHSRRGREVFSVSRSHGDMSRLEGDGDGGVDGERPFVEPLLVSQFDDDSDSDHDDELGQVDELGDLDQHLAENDAELFGDFEGAYNYDEADEKVMLATATAMPFSKQHHPRSLRSVRSQRSQRSLAAYRLHESIPEQPWRSPGSSMLNKPDETSSHLQSWIEHASRRQQELVQHQQLLSQGSVAHVRSAFYEDDEDDEEENDVVEAVDQPVENEVMTAAVHNEVAPSVVTPAVTAPAVSVPSTTPPAPITTITTTPATGELQTSLHKAQPVPLIFFSQPGIVGIPLPREVVDTLRVSVSCFPETMLSLSSFSIQTIRSYSRKVRRCSQAEADDTYRLLMAPASPPGLLPPSPTSTHHVPPSLSPASPTNMSFDLGTGVARSMTGASSTTSHSSRRFWKLPKKMAGGSANAGHNSSGSRPPPNLNIFTGFRSSTSSNGSSNHSAGYSLSPTGMAPSLPRLSSVGRRGSSRHDAMLGAGDDDQGKANGLCFKRIFPTGSDYLCDALYAHIIAFNYISLLCPPPPQAGEEVTAQDTTALSAPVAAEPVTAAHTMTTLASSATLFESAQQQQRRQTIRVYVGSDVPLPLSGPLAELDDAQTNANTSSRLLSITSSRPASRGTYSGTGAGSGANANDDGRMISRKAAALLGITETLEPDSAAASSPSQSPRKSSSAGMATSADPSSVSSARSNSLARRYNSMRRRHHLRMGHSISESTAAASKMIKMALPGASKQPSPVEISKPIYEATDVVIPADGVPAASSSLVRVVPTPAPSAAAVAAAAAADASMRDLHAGLHACISQLVATMKLTTGQLGNTLLNAEVARDIDPLFLRTLCELVRSQEEQF